MDREDEFELTPEQKKFDTEVSGFKLSYSIKEKSYLCKLHNLDKSGNSFEIEFPIPDSDLDKLETLIEPFAQSEGGRVTKSQV